MKYCQVPPLPRPDMRYSSHINTLRSMEHRWFRARFSAHLLYNETGKYIFEKV
jgi:hypothetical protein